MRKAIGTLVCLAVCCGKSSQKAQETPAAAGSSAATAAGSGSSASASAGSGSTTVAGAGSDSPGDFDRHVKAGHKAEQAKDWATAVKELDAAAAARPDDAVTLAELTWAAGLAKQLDHAREVGARAVLAARAAKQKKVEAMALFNLGLAEEDADAHAARSLYKASLDLRPNKTVEARLEKADDTKPATPDGDALLAKVAVTRVEDNRKAPETPADTKLLAALTGAGADWDMGAGHGAMRFDIACEIAAAKCTFSGGGMDVAPAAGGKAKAVISALEAEGAKPAGDKLTAHVDCLTMDEGRPDGLMSADSCDVTPAK
jgi:tetratricopeptide (TPR) repeat protein